MSGSSNADLSAAFEGQRTPLFASGSRGIVATPVGYSDLTSSVAGTGTGTGTEHDKLSGEGTAPNSLELSDGNASLASRNANENPQHDQSNAAAESGQDQAQKVDGSGAGSSRRSGRRGRRRGRRRRRGLQRARARERAREDAQAAANAELDDNPSETTSEDDSIRDGNDVTSDTAVSRTDRSRSPRRQRSAESEERRRGMGSLMRPTITALRLQSTPCRVPNCEWTGPLEEASRHARQTHQEAILRGAHQILSVPLAYAAYTRYWRLIDAHDELFLVQFRRRAGGRRRLQAAVQLVGPTARAARFFYLLHMEAVEPLGQDASSRSDTAALEQGVNLNIPLPSTRRISFVLGQTSSTRVDLEPAMISLWSAYNFTRLVDGDGSPESTSATHSRDISCNREDLPRVLDLALSIQRMEDQQAKC